MDLSKRPESDLTGALQHALAALERVARDVTGRSQGDILGANPGKEARLFLLR